MPAEEGKHKDEKDPVPARQQEPASLQRGDTEMGFGKAGTQLSVEDKDDDASSGTEMDAVRGGAAEKDVFDGVSDAGSLVQRFDGYASDRSTGSLMTKVAAE